MKKILEVAAKHEQRAREIIRETDIINIWQSVGAEINLVGSLNMGLMVKHKDIDFHIYSSPLSIAQSFSAMQKLAENPSIKQIQYVNLIDTEEKCLEWHAWYLDRDNELWQLDLIHILKGSFYDGYMERVAKRIKEVLTPELKNTIMRLKYETPETEKIAGIEYYQAVIRDGVGTYEEFMQWRKDNPLTGVAEWIP